MADISLKRKHSFDAPTAQAKLKLLVDKFQASYGSQIEVIDWNAEKTGARAEGKMFKGQFSLAGDVLVVDIDLKGFAAKMAKGMVESRLQKTVGEEFPA